MKCLPGCLPADQPGRDDVDLIVGSYEERHLNTATFDIVALHEIADAKNSLIGVSAYILSSASNLSMYIISSFPD